MNWNHIVYAFIAVFAATTFFAAFRLGTARTNQSADRSGPLEGYLLAGGSLGRVPLISLLLSTSFGINTIFYQGYLGYTVGAWGLIVQLAWAFGFLLLSRKTESVQKVNGLHDLLAVKFGKNTRLVAALFSLGGMLVFMGWEADIGKETLSGLLALGGTSTNPSNPSTAATWVIAAIAAGCVMYTVLGGLRGNAYANAAQNVLKFFSFCALLWFVWELFSINSDKTFKDALLPSYHDIQKNLGLWALLGNILFGLAWQFVDMTTWQSIAASSRSKTEDLRRNILYTAGIVFITPGILGTLFGVLLSYTDGAHPNVLVNAFDQLESVDPLIAFLVAAAIIACVMSLIDGVILGASYTWIVDIRHSGKRLQELDSDKDRAEGILSSTRILLAIFAFSGIFAIPAMFDWFGVTVFDSVYIVIVLQLAILGPVLLALRPGTETNGAQVNSIPMPMWLPIILAAIVGFACNYIGNRHEDAKWLAEGAGTFTMTTSILVSLLILKFRKIRTKS